MDELKKDVEIIRDEEDLELTKSQKDRFLQFELVQQDMLDLISSTIKKVNAKDSVKEQTLEHLARKMTENYEDMSARDFAFIFEKLSKSDDELSKGIFDIIKGQQKIIIENAKEPVAQEEVVYDKNLTKEDVKQVKNFMNNMDKAKELVNLMNNIKDTEFVDEEEDKED